MLKVALVHTAVRRGRRHDTRRGCRRLRIRDRARLARRPHRRADRAGKTAAAAPAPPRPPRSLGEPLRPRGRRARFAMLRWSAGGCASTARNSRFNAMHPDLASPGRLPHLQHGLARQGPPAFSSLPSARSPSSRFSATSRFMVNQFGYLGGGYPPLFPAARRTRGRPARRQLCSLLLSAGFIPVGLLAWASSRPFRFDARMLFMLLASATHGPVRVSRARSLGHALRPAQGQLQQTSATTFRWSATSSSSAA